MRIWGEKSIFEFIMKINSFCGGKFLKRSLGKLMSLFLERTLGSLCFYFLILKSSFMSWSSLRGFCSGKITISWFWGHVQSEKYAFLGIWIFSQKWLRRSNHYAHKTRSKILCRAPVSILQYLSPRPQNLRKTSYYSSLAWMSTWIFGWRRRRRQRQRRVNNCSIWPDPNGIACRDEICRSGNPSLRYRFWLILRNS